MLLISDGSLWELTHRIVKEKQSTLLFRAETHLYVLRNLQSTQFSCIICWGSTERGSQCKRSSDQAYIIIRGRKAPSSLETTHDTFHLIPVVISHEQDFHGGGVHLAMPRENSGYHNCGSYWLNISLFITVVQLNGLLSTAFALWMLSSQISKVPRLRILVLLFRHCSSPAPCARSSFLKMTVLKGGRTFKKWGLVEEGWFLTTILCWCHAFVLPELWTKEAVFLL